MINRRTAPRIRTRLSAVTNSFVQAILPGSAPTEAQMSQTLRQLGQSWTNRSCVYCGARSTDFDHFQAIVRGRRPSGYLNEARNLVPACGTCNQSKGSRDWRDWMLGEAKNSPTSRKIPDIEERLELLDAFAEWASCRAGDLVRHVEPQLWRSYWNKLDQIESLMLNAQVEADRVRRQIEEGLAAANDGM